MKKLKSFNINWIDGNVIIALSNENIKIYEDKNKLILKFILLLKKGNSEMGILEELRLEYSELMESDILFLMSEIIKKNNLLSEINQNILTEYELEKYDRQLNLFQRIQKVSVSESQIAQKKILDGKVLVLGVGGVGSHVAISLASIGIGELHILDFDKIELSNTTRQILYNENDIGNYKVEVAKEKLQKYNKKCSIHCYNEELSSKNQVDKILNEIIQKHDIDFVIVTLDFPRGQIRHWIDEVLYEKNIPYIFNGSYAWDVSIGPMIIKEKTSRFNDLVVQKKLEFEVEAFNELGNVSNVYEPLNAIAAQFCVNEVIKYLTKLGELSLLETEKIINLLDLSISDIRYKV